MSGMRLEPLRLITAPKECWLWRRPRSLAAHSGKILRPSRSFFSHEPATCLKKALDRMLIFVCHADQDRRRRNSSLHPFSSSPGFTRASPRRFIMTSNNPRSRDLFRSACAPDLARMMIELVEDDQAVVDCTRTRLLESVTTQRDYAVAFLRMFSEDQVPGIDEIFAAARKFVGR